MRFHFHLLTIFVCFTCGVAVAQTKGPARAERAADSEPVAENKTEPQPNENLTDALEKLKQLSEDEKLFRKLTGDDSKRPAQDITENPLENAVSGMRSAKEQLAKQNTGQETRDIQQQVVRDLEKLIELARQAEQSPQNQQNQPQMLTQNMKQEQKPEPSGSGGKPQGSAAGQPQAGKQPKSQESELAKESSDEIRQAAKAAAEAAAKRRRLEDDVWGHLPPAMRNKLLNMRSGDKYLQKYEDLFQRYFEALAEQNQR